MKRAKDCWDLDIREGKLYLPNGKIILWTPATEQWLIGMNSMWNEKPSEWLGDLIENSTGFLADYKNSDPEGSYPGEKI